MKCNLTLLRKLCSKSTLNFHFFDCRLKDSLDGDKQLNPRLVWSCRVLNTIISECKFFLKDLNSTLFIELLY